MSGLTERVGTPQTPAGGAGDAQELERLIVIRPVNTADGIISAVSYWKQHDSLEGYATERLREEAENKKQAVSALSTAFKSIVLYEAATYIGDTYALRFGDEPETRDCVTTLNQAETALMSRDDYSEAHRKIVQAYENIKQRVELPVGGRAQGAYLFDIGEILELCAPGEILPAINVRFQGKQLHFSITEHGEYTKEMGEYPDFAQFAKRYSGLFRPVSGYMRFKSPQRVEYADRFLDTITRRHHIMNPSEITIGERPPLEFFRIGDRR